MGLAALQSSGDEEGEAKPLAKKMQMLQSGLLGVKKAKDIFMKSKAKPSDASSKPADKGHKSG
jgi:hypothetical protein